MKANLYIQKKFSGCLLEVGGEVMSKTANGYGVSFWGDEYALKLDCDDGYTIL